MSRFTVVHVSKTGVVTDVGRFDTHDEVMDFYDKELMSENPQGVLNGDYQIDDLEDVDSEV